MAIEVSCQHISPGKLLFLLPSVLLDRIHGMRCVVFWRIVICHVSSFSTSHIDHLRRYWVYHISLSPDHKRCKVDFFFDPVSSIDHYTIPWFQILTQLSSRSKGMRSSCELLRVCSSNWGDLPSSEPCLGVQVARIQTLQSEPNERLAFLTPLPEYTN